METVIQDHTPLADYLKGEPSFVLSCANRESHTATGFRLQKWYLGR